MVREELEQVKRQIEENKQAKGQNDCTIDESVHQESKNDNADTRRVMMAQDTEGTQPSTGETVPEPGEQIATAKRRGARK